MEKNTSFDLSKLREIPISKVVERWGGKLIRSGSHWVTNCVWHEDEHPSMTLYEVNGENRCHCFACGRGGSAIDYVMAKDGVDFRGACELLEREFLGAATDGWVSPRRQTERVVKKKEVVYVPREWLDEHVSVENSFCRCLSQMFDRHLVEHLTEEYRLGCYDNGFYPDCVLFPSIDQEDRVRNVKVQRYCTDVSSDRFAHGDKKCCYWLGTKLVKEGVVPVSGTAGSSVVFDNECLFGEHLLRRYPQNVVALVESPKNALIGAAVQPKYVWVATGNKAMLKRSVMERLRGRQVIVFPDRDAIGEWKTLLHGMRDIAMFSVSEFCERMAPDGDEKFDIADYVVKQFILTRKTRIF